ncbi:MAG TPA: TIGR03759 family integrating conjugative element protein, partial [Legionella sp.]|nr:TIGR03759 family integrating conjugative element protein [Legionella sp.]
MRQSIVLSVLLVVSGFTHAQFSIPGIETQRFNALASTDKTLAQTGLAINEDDITPDQDTNKL